MAISLPLEGQLVAPVMRIGWCGQDALFWQGAKALLCLPQFLLHPAQAWTAVADLAQAGADLDLLVWDLGMARAEDMAALQAAWPSLLPTPVLVVSAHMDQGLLNALLTLGVSGVLSKQIDGQYLVQSVKQAVAGQKVLAPEYRGLVPDPEAVLFQTLTAREREILAYLAKGASNKVIAEALAVAPSTVKVHVQNILRKLQLSSRVQAAVYAVRLQG
ncbi:MAG: response regulator transcription factor [Neisseriaceae bacterium]|nr:response regulator transcription factor [Neisseriaceae bacterium]